MRKLIAPVIASAVLLACFLASRGWRVGDMINVDSARLYLDEPTFIAAVQSMKIGQDPEGKSKRITHCKVRIISPEIGGAKVGVHGGNLDGEIGWLLDKDLGKRAP